MQRARMDEKGKLKSGKVRQGNTWLAKPPSLYHFCSSQGRESRGPVPSVPTKWQCSAKEASKNCVHSMCMGRKKHLLQHVPWNTSMSPAQLHFVAAPWHTRHAYGMLTHGSVSQEHWRMEKVWKSMKKLSSEKNPYAIFYPDIPWPSLAPSAIVSKQEAELRQHDQLTIADPSLAGKAGTKWGQQLHKTEPGTSRLQRSWILCFCLLWPFWNHWAGHVFSYPCCLFCIGTCETSAAAIRFVMWAVLGTFQPATAGKAYGILWHPMAVKHKEWQKLVKSIPGNPIGKWYKMMETFIWKPMETASCLRCRNSG